MLLDLGEMLVMTAEQQGAVAVVLEGQRAGVEGGGSRFQALASWRCGRPAGMVRPAGPGATGSAARLWG
jgi:hypothetical protein